MTMISTRGRYALRVMIDLAMRDKDEFVPLKAIAQRQEISEKYLEAIMKSLVQQGLVVGLRGKGGGYRLARRPAEYTVGRILKATEGSLAPVACLESDAETCSRSETCATLPIWQELYRLIDNYFEGITLDKLAGQAAACGGDSYCL